MKKAELLYNQIEQVLMTNGYITQEVSDIISRKGSRKERLWKRHIIDLCEFVLNHRSIDDDTRTMLEKDIMWCKS